MEQRLFLSRFMQRAPAVLPPAIPGIGDDMERAMQHAPHSLHFVGIFNRSFYEIQAV